MISKKAKYIIDILAALFLIAIFAAVNLRKAPQDQSEQQSQTSEANYDGSIKTVKVEIDSVNLLGVGPESDTTTIEMSDYSEFYNIDRLSEEKNAFYK